MPGVHVHRVQRIPALLWLPPPCPDPVELLLEAVERAVKGGDLSFALILGEAARRRGRESLWDVAHLACPGLVAVTMVKLGFEGLSGIGWPTTPTPNSGNAEAEAAASWAPPSKETWLEEDMDDDAAD